ncbi:MAG TPA: BrxA/BrxB family bacilliredoxin [Gemmatimonadales bacterium]
MRYSPILVQPMREELTKIGFRELLTTEDVEQAFADQRGTMLVVINSVCGCAAGMARPGVRMALEHTRVPDQLVTAFAGMETDAVDATRARFAPYPPSSPQVALFKDGTLVHMLERKNIEGRDANEIAGELCDAFDRHCGP